MLVLCGLRTGKICPISIQGVNREDVLEISPITLHPRINVGSDSVKLITDINEETQNTAFVLCDGLLHQLEWTNSTAIEEFRLYRLLLEQEGSHGVMTSAITSVFPLADSSDSTAKGLAVASRTNIHTGKITRTRYLWHPQSHSPSSGRPKHLAYSQYLHALITSSVEFELDNSTKQQFVTSTISILPVDNFQTSIIKPELLSPTTTTTSTKADTWTSLPGETLTALLEWKWPKARTSTLLIASFSFLDAAGTPRGILKYLKVTRQHLTQDHASKHHFALSHTSLETAPGYALCQFQRDTLVYASGNTLRLRPFNWQEKRFTRGDEVRLPSAAVYISAGEHVLYVTTHAHGLCVLALVQGKLKIVGGDVQAREGIAHLALEERKVVLVTTKVGEVVALSLDMDTDADAEPGRESSSIEKLSNVKSEMAMYASTALMLPSAITRLIRPSTSIRPPWKGTSTNVPNLHGQEEIYGIAVDGSMWTLRLLDNNAYQLLHHVQSVFEAHTGENFPSMGVGGADSTDECRKHTRAAIQSTFTAHATTDTYLLPSTTHSSSPPINSAFLQRAIRRPDAARLLDEGGVRLEMFARIVGKDADGLSAGSGSSSGNKTSIVAAEDRRKGVAELLVWLRGFLEMEMEGGW